MTRSTLAACTLVAGWLLASTGCSSDSTPAGATAPSNTTTETSTTSTTSTLTTITTIVVDTTLAARLDTSFDAPGFAAQLSDEHAAMVDTNRSDDERARAGADFQLTLRALAEMPTLDEDVLIALDPAARPSVERIVRARQFVQARSAARPPQPPPTDLPAWTIIEPEPVDILLADYAEAEQLTGIAWYWLAAVHLQETRVGRIQGVSSAGAVGPMQFLPTTWERCCTGDPLNTRDAIIGAATYLSQSGGPDDMAKALYEYNPNEAYVAVVTAYAESLRDDPDLFPGFHGFQVFYGTEAGTVRLPVGYSETQPIDAADYLRSNPADAA